MSQVSATDKNINVSENRALQHTMKDSLSVFLYKKTERIALALYMVTGFFDREEPLRYSIRQKANELLEELVSLRTPGISVEKQKVIVWKLITDLVSYLNLASGGGLISEMNADVLCKELNVLGERIGEIQIYQEEQPAFSNDFFESKEEKEAGRGGYHGQVNSFEKRSTDSKDNSGAGAQQGTHIRRDDAVGGDVQAARLSSTVQSPKPAVQAKKSKRQREILKLLKEKGEISVKDAAVVITNCSEKTLQRELMVLVNEGVLKKEGERRWTRYSFA